MKELAHRVASGGLKWNQKVRLEKELESHPVSTLYAKTRGGLVTLQTVAQHMIAASDNSAADVLIKLLGANSLETCEDRTPFLTSQQFYKLKADRKLADSYRTADTAKRRKILDKVQNRPFRLSKMLPTLTSPEWNGTQTQPNFATQFKALPAKKQCSSIPALQRKRTGLALRLRRAAKLAFSISRMISKA